jgi:hypothetical protein
MGIQCKICKNNFAGLRFLAIHLNNKHKDINLKRYYDEYININEQFTKCICGNFVIFKNLSDGYRQNCGNKGCINKLKLIKSEKTCLERHGVKNYAQCKEYREKVEKTNLEKRGYKHHLSDPTTIKKREDKLFKDKGVTNVRQLESVKEKSKKTLIERLGVDNCQKSSIIREKTKKTNLKKYGNTCSLRGEEQQKITKKTNFDKYGNEIYQRSDAYKRKKQTDLMNRLLNTNRLNGKVIPLFNEFTNSKDKNLLWECTQCGEKINDSISNGHTPRCLKCDPYLNGTSKVEIDVANFLEQHTKIERNKKFSGIKNKTGTDYELDIFIPEYNIGVELDGLFHHSELSGDKNKNYHLNKTNYFKELHIQVIHIFDSEWYDNEKIIQSILLSKLHKNTKIIYARKCILKEVSQKESTLFLDKNHIQSFIYSSIRIGLYYNDELISLMTFNKSRFNKQYEYELSRFCAKLNTSVIGGFNKLLQYFVKNYSSSIISYADLRFSNGDIYIKNNFTLLKQTPPNYFYIKNRRIVGSRIQFQKHKLSKILSIFDVNLTEWENMQLNGYDRIFDCGNLVFIYNKK